MEKYIYIILLLLGVHSNAQNLATNSSFEIYTTCPASPGQIGQLGSIVTDWVSNGGDINYFNACSPSCAEFGVCGSSAYLGVRNRCGYQLPYDGNGYVGILLSGRITYLIPPFDTVWAAHTFLGTQLAQILTPGTRYFVTAHISRSGSYYGYEGACNNFGFHFYTYPHNAISNSCLTDNNPQVHEPSIILDSVNWTRISGSFIADSAYQYLALGNFYENANTDTVDMNNKHGAPDNYAYYYVDYVSVSEDSLWDVTAMPEITKLGQQIEIYPNPASTVLNIKNIRSEKTLFTISDVLGKVIYKKLSESNFLQIDIIDIKPGLYFIRNSEGVNKKFVKL